MKFIVILFGVFSTSLSLYSEDSFFSTTELSENEDTTLSLDEFTTSIPDNRFLFYKPYQHKPLFHNAPGQLSCTVAIYNEGRHICSGFLWSEWFIVTTAECVSGLVDSSEIHIIFDESPNMIQKVSVARYHRNYKSDPEAFNIAILKTCLPVLKPKTNCVLAVSTERNLCNNLPKILKSESFRHREETTFELVPKANGSICVSPTRNSCCLKQTGSLSDCNWDQGGALFSAETNVHGLITSNPENNCNKDLIKMIGFTEEILYWIRKFSNSYKISRCMKFFRGSPVEPF